MKHYRQSSPITCYNAEQSHCTHIIGSPQCIWAIAVYTNKQRHVIYLTELFLKHQILWEASMVGLHILSISSDISLVVLFRAAFRNWNWKPARFITPLGPTSRVMSSVSYQWPAPYTFPPFSQLLPQIGLIAYCQFGKHERFLQDKPCPGEGLWGQCAWGILPIIEISG